MESKKKRSKFTIMKFYWHCASCNCDVEPNDINEDDDHVKCGNPANMVLIDEQPITPTPQ